MHAYSLREVVELGIQIEKNGYAYYTALADKVTDERLKSLILFLAGEEAQHIVAFENIRDQVEQFEQDEEYPSEYFSYLNRLASEHVFIKRDGNECALHAESPLAMLSCALEFENDSIAIYKEMKKLVPAGSETAVDVMIQEEEKHVAKITELMGIYGE